MQVLKRIFVLNLLLAAGLSALSQATQAIDSPPTRSQLNALAKNVAVTIKNDSANKAFSDSLARAFVSVKAKADSAANCGCQPKTDGEVKDVGGWVLTFLPALLFLLLLLWLLNSKGLKDFSLKEAMSENAYPSVHVDNPQYSSANLTNAALAGKENLAEIIPPTIEKTYMTASHSGVAPNVVTTYAPPPPNPSISRYIAFITSVLTLVIVLGVACFYIYHYIRTGCPPELTGISTLLIALGIGVLPYVFNKVAGAIGKSKDDSN